MSEKTPTSLIQAANDNRRNPHPERRAESTAQIEISKSQNVPPLEMMHPETIQRFTNLLRRFYKDEFNTVEYPEEYLRLAEPLVVVGAPLESYLDALHTAGLGTGTASKSQIEVHLFTALQNFFQDVDSDIKGKRIVSLNPQLENIKSLLRLLKRELQKDNES